MQVSRRSFLGASAGAMLAAGTMGTTTAHGANDRVGVCCVGINAQGRNHIRRFLEVPDAEVVALCDVDQNVLETRAAEFEKATGKRPKLYRDMREAFADEAIHAVSIATPNHWHALAAAWACQAGKDVYVEKPFAHSFWEGQQLVKLARASNRIVQHGTQQRSDVQRIRDMKLLAEGQIIGPVVHARGYVYKNGNRMDIGRGKPGDPPPHVDYNLWLGPAAERPFLWREGGEATNAPGGLFMHYNWHWFWDFGNGESGNQGVHEMDVAVWAAAGKGMPVRVSSTGGRYKWQDDAQTPNTQAMQFTYADGTMLTFEVRNLGSFREACDDECANSAFGTDGYWVKGKGFFDYKGTPIPLPAEELPPSTSEFANFIASVRNRDWNGIHGNPDDAFRSCAHIHFGNIAYRLKRTLDFDPVTGQFNNDAEANALLKAAYREPFVFPQIA